VNRRRTKAAKPISPVPTKLKLPVSGTVLTSVVVAKHVAEGAQKDPATWMFPSVMPLEVSALVRTRRTDEAVADPVASKQMVSCEMPPHAPDESKIPPRSVSVDVIPFSLTFPEKPITGPPSRTEPDVISMSTQTEVLEMLMPPHIPPCVRVAVPICIPPADIVSVMVMESAKAAGMTVRVAATKTANIESLTLLRTDVPPLCDEEQAKALAVRPPSRLWKFEKITEIIRAEEVTSLLGELCSHQRSGGNRK